MGIMVVRTFVSSTSKARTSPIGCALSSISRTTNLRALCESMDRREKSVILGTITLPMKQELYLATSKARFSLAKNKCLRGSNKSVNFPCLVGHLLTMSGLSPHAWQGTSGKLQSCPSGRALSFAINTLGEDCSRTRRRHRQIGVQFLTSGAELRGEGHQGSSECSSVRGKVYPGKHQARNSRTEYIA